MSRKKLLWVGWDGADWEHIAPLLDRGELPNLERLIDHGVMGNLATHHPILSPMLWNTAATGKYAYKHGVLGFVEPDPVHGGARPFQSTSRKTKAVWNILSQNGFRSNVVNWWASHPAEKIEGCVVSNMLSGIEFESGKGFTCPTGAVHPSAMTDEIAKLKVFAEELTGEEILPFVPEGQRVCQDDDPRLAMLAGHLAEMITTHGIATYLMENTEWDFMATYFTAIDHFCHSFMSYYPPKLPWVSDSDFEMYRHVVSGVYRMSDMMLGRMMHLAGKDATILVCSDHGFQSGPLRLRSLPNEPTGPEFWHRQYGMIVVSGPGIKQDERVYSATLADVCPTILTLFGLPVGSDMDGRILADIFDSPPGRREIPSWDLVEGNGKAGMHDGEIAMAPEEAQALFQQFVALGYVEAPSDSKEDNAQSADMECKYNLARNLNSYGKHLDAQPLLSELVMRAPWESRFLIHFARTLVSAGKLSDAERVLSASFDLKMTEDPTARLLVAEIRAKQGRVSESFSELKQVEELRYIGPGILMHVGICYLELQKFLEAERVFRRILRIHPDHAEALQGLSSVLIRRGENQEAADAALAAVSLLHRLPIAHLNLGIALTRGGNPESAIQALETALRFNPKIPRAHRWLQFIYTSMIRDDDKAKYHRFCALNQSLDRKRPIDSIATTQESSGDGWLELPEIPSERERAEILEQKRPTTSSKFCQSNKEFVVVSGLPRSGTSAMMQMLEAGGLPAKTDGKRKADVDNPQGYFEWEDIKRLGDHPEILDAEGVDQHALKVVSPLLNQLPYQHQYKVLFMVRPIQEVVTSQAKMINRLHTVGAHLTEERLSEELEMHRMGAIRWLQLHPRADVCVVDFVELLENPDLWIRKIVDFLGTDRLPNWTNMRTTIEPSLRRNR